MSPEAENSTRNLNLIIGGITLLLLFLVAIALVMSTRSDLLDTSEDYYISTYYTNIGMLQEGAPVRYRGVKIGRVTDITLKKDMRIHVICKVILSNKIPDDSKLAVAATTVSGDSYLNLIPGSSSTNIRNSDTPDNPPMLKGLNFIDIRTIGSIFTDMKDITSVFINSFNRLCGKGSITVKRYKELINRLPAFSEEITMFNHEKRYLLHSIEKLTPEINRVRDLLTSCMEGITEALPPKKLQTKFKSISENISDISQTFADIRNSDDITAIQANISSINNWAGSLRIADHSILGIMLSKDCGGMSETVKMVGKAVKTAQDFSLFKKLGFYFDGKKLLANFEKRTHAEYLPSSIYMYQWSLFSYQRYRHNCDLPCGVKSCPKELK